jgi:hypothetical protein
MLGSVGWGSLLSPVGLVGSMAHGARCIARAGCSRGGAVRLDRDRVAHPDHEGHGAGGPSGNLGTVRDGPQIAWEDRVLDPIAHSPRTQVLLVGGRADFARLERPRVASFAIGGELPEGREAEDIQKKVA